MLKISICIMCVKMYGAVQRTALHSKVAHTDTVPLLPELRTNDYTSGGGGTPWS